MHRLFLALLLQLIMVYTSTSTGSRVIDPDNSPVFNELIKDLTEQSRTEKISALFIKLYPEYSAVEPIECLKMSNSNVVLFFSAKTRNSRSLFLSILNSDQSNAFASPGNSEMPSMITLTTALI